jgi:hypothetical protein
MTDVNEEWGDLAKVWRAEAAAVSASEIEVWLRRERARLRRARIAEFASLGIGLAGAAWAAVATPFVFVAGLFALFCALTLWFTLRFPATPLLRDGETLATSLDNRIAYEDWLLSQLRFGRALSYLPLFLFVFLIAGRLQHAAKAGLMSLAPLVVCLVTALAIAIWNAVLLRRAQRRRARLDGFNSALKKNI